MLRLCALFSVSPPIKSWRQRYVRYLGSPAGRTAGRCATPAALYLLLAITTTLLQTYYSLQLIRFAMISIFSPPARFIVLLEMSSYGVVPDSGAPRGIGRSLLTSEAWPSRL